MERYQNALYSNMTNFFTLYPHYEYIYWSRHIKHSSKAENGQINSILQV